MQRHHQFFLTGAVTAVFVAAGSVAYAARGGGDNDALSIANAKVMLTQAIAIAEQTANGKALRAEYEHSEQGWVYEVEVFNGANVFDVRIDADKGTVISSVQDKADNDDHDHDHGRKD